MESRQSWWRRLPNTIAQGQERLTFRCITDELLDDVDCELGSDCGRVWLAGCGCRVQPPVRALATVTAGEGNAWESASDCGVGRAHCTGEGVQERAPGRGVSVRGKEKGRVSVYRLSPKLGPETKRSTVRLSQYFGMT